MLYRLNSLDVVDGEINDEHYTGDVLELPEVPTKDQVRTAFQECGRDSAGAFDLEEEEGSPNYFIVVGGVRRFRLAGQE